MRFMIVVKATRDSENGVLPDHDILTRMGHFNEELVNAGIMVAGEGLRPSSMGARVKLIDGKATVTDGPFVETKELIGGFWMWQCTSKQEAIDWVKRVPTIPGVETTLEIRQVFEAEDFGAEFTPEARAQEERLRARIEGKK